MNFRALLNLIFTRSFWSFSTMANLPFALLKGFLIGILACLIILPRLLVWILAGLLYFLPECIFRCLPMKVRTPVRQCRRYATKIGLGVEQKVEMKMIALKKDREPGQVAIATYQGGTGKQDPLSDFLSVYDTLLLVTKHLHYDDIESLRCVSKSVREAVVPQQDVFHRLNAFKKYTCQIPDRESKLAKCWVCYKQVCRDCEHLRAFPQTRPLFHMENCTPYCTRCYHSCVLAKRPAPSQRFTHARCRCGPTTAKPGLILRMVNSGPYYANAQLKLPRHPRNLCRSCNSKTDDDLFQAIDYRAETILAKGRDRHNQLWTQCSRPGCDRPLKTGPRWWVCGGNMCGFECRSFIHQAWSFDETGNGKRITGEEAV